MREDKPSEQISIILSNVKLLWCNMTDNIELLKTKIHEVNSFLTAFGMLPLAVVKPSDILPQKKNAHYFSPEKFKQLVSNIKKYGRLSSIPIVYKDGDKFRLIDGAHRVDGAKEAKLDWILVFVDSPKSEDEIISKQLSHNTLIGQDDPIILAELFNSIEDIEFKIETGLSSEIAQISYQSLNFKIGESKELVLMFMPDELENIDKGLENIIEFSSAKTSSEVRVTSIQYYDKFLELMRKIKKIENIKNNGIAVLRLIELANERILQIKSETK